MAEIKSAARPGAAHVHVAAVCRVQLAEKPRAGECRPESANGPTDRGSV